MKIKASFLVTALLASASCFAADTYQVSTSVYSQGKLVASPTMVVEADKIASIRMDNGFSYNLTVKANQDETAGIVAAVTVGDSTINPSFTIAYGKEATMEIGAQKLTLLVNKVGSQQSASFGACGPCDAHTFARMRGALAGVRGFNGFSQ